MKLSPKRTEDEFSTMTKGKTMENKELSLLAFVVEALVASPSPAQFETVQQELDLMRDKSPLFKGAIEVVKKVLDGAKSKPNYSDRSFREGILDIEARKLSSLDDEASRSVGEVIKWALGNRYRNRAPNIRAAVRSKH